MKVISFFTTQTDFYPRSPCGERPSTHCSSRTAPTDFYPRSPCGERHAKLSYLPVLFVFLSTLSLRRATHYDNYNLHCVEISIHALLAESDMFSVFASPFSIFYFYPRSPCGERQANRCTTIPYFNFYPRSPCGERPTNHDRGASNHRISIHALLAESDTPITFRHCTTYLFLSTLSLRRATHYDNYNLHCVEISIHALLAESDS